MALVLQGQELMLWGSWDQKRQRVQLLGWGLLLKGLVQELQ